MFNKWTLLLLLTVFTTQPQASELPEFPFIVVTGKAEIEVAPDEAEISFSVMEFSDDPEMAMSVVLDRGADILKLAEKYGIPKDDINSYGIDKNTKRSRGEGREPLEILGYEVTQQYLINISDTAVYSDFVNTLLAIRNVSGVFVEFDVSNRDDIARSLVKQASDDAKRRATDLANGLGVEIDSVYAAGERTSFGTYFAMFGLRRGPEIQADIVTGSRVSSNMFVPKSIEIHQSMNVVFKIKP